MNLDINAVLKATQEFNANDYHSSLDLHFSMSQLIFSNLYCFDLINVVGVETVMKNVVLVPAWYFNVH